MRKYVFLWMFLFCLGCEQNDIAEYQEEPRINFMYSVGKVRFSDQDYLNDRLWTEASVEIQLIGRFLLHPLTYCLKAEPEEETVYVAQVRCEEAYTMLADTSEMRAVVTVERPGLLDVVYKTVVVFDMNNSLHQFARGKSESLEYEMTVEYKIKPNSWNSEFFGEYSNSKYKFMMDEFGTVFENIPLTSESKDRVRKAYARYRENNPPLMDDQDPQQEIVFPV